LKTKNHGLFEAKNRRFLEAKNRRFLAGFFLLLAAAILSLSPAGCDNGSNNSGGGADKWSALAGEWEWAEGSYFITLKFHAEKKNIFGYTGYEFEEYREVPGSTGWGDYWFCSYDGITLRRYDEKNVTECTWTITKSGDGRTITFSNYIDAEDPSKTSRLNGKTFARRP
jgi:hypothetical protein